MNFESALAHFKRNIVALQQWIVDLALRAHANAPVQMKHGFDKQINFKSKWKIFAIYKDGRKLKHGDSLINTNKGTP